MEDLPKDIITDAKTQPPEQDEIDNAPLALLGETDISLARRGEQQEQKQKNVLMMCKYVRVLTE